MKTKDRLLLEEKLSEWLEDVIEFPFYTGNNTVKYFADGVEAMFNAMAEAVKLEAQNAIEED